MNATTTRFDDLDSRRQEAGISYAALAKLSGVSHPALQRLLTGKVEGPTLTSIAAVARVLGMGAVRFLDDGSVKFDPTLSTQDLRERQARKKAERLVGMIQGASALEGQAVSPADIHAMYEHMYNKLLAGSNLHLWSE
jgi:transcriptional regulator with XRE-family HTH domain